MMLKFINLNIKKFDENFDITHILSNFKTINTFKTKHLFTDVIVNKPNIELPEYKIKIESYNDYLNLR